jgi:vacuolar-type H+-ATPase subunit F/Vma7
MEDLLSQHIEHGSDAKVVVLFGGSPVRRDEVIRSLRLIGGVSIYGTLSEEEGLRKVNQLARVDLVVIGSRYSGDQRRRIKEYLKASRPEVVVTEPGLDYPYDEPTIRERIRDLLTH